MTDKPTKQDIDKTPDKADKAKKPGKDPSKKDDELSDKELDKASGGRATVMFTQIKGPSFVQTQPYRKSAEGSSPVRKRSLAALYKELADD